MSSIGLVGIANPSSLLRFNLMPDPSVSNAPAGFTAAVAAAALQIANACPKTAVTLNITYGYDTLGGNPPGGIGASAESSDSNSVANIAYSTIRSAYASKATTPAMVGVANALPTGTTLNGFSSFQVPRAQRKALGMIPAVDSVEDGSIVIGAGVPSANWLGVALHELAQAMGRLAGDAPFCFSSFSSAGVWETTASAGVAHYFSIDGGVTKLADYDTSSTGDLADFLNGPDGSGVQDSGQTNADAFDAYYITSPLTKQTLTTVDIQHLNAMGFQ